MASSFLSRPGKKFGPCPFGCTHLDCKASRQTANCLCRFCGKQIGYENDFFDEWTDQTEADQRKHGRHAFMVHARCIYEALDQAQCPAPTTGQT